MPFAFAAGTPDQALMVKAGDCAAFRSDVWQHRGSANTSDQTRHIMQVRA